MIDKVRLAGISYESLVNGPGIRRVFFAQGCLHRCEGCHNPETHDFNGGELFQIDKLIEDVKENPMIKGITFSGGDPFEQAEAFNILAKKLKEINKNIWCYTGYTFENIIKNKDNKAWQELLSNIDVLIDGKFILSKKTEILKYRGSENQRIVDVKESIKMKKITTLDY